MPLRVAEIHPSVVHFPIALTPTSVALDALGAARGDQGLERAGGLLMQAAFVGAIASAVAGIAAQGAASRVDRPGRARELLTTHRTMNVVATALLGLMAAHRARGGRPGPGYLAAGLAASAGIAYSAYLGGRMTYEHGVGVAPAGGLRNEEASPEMRGPRDLGPALRATAGDIRRGVRGAAQQVAAGELVPDLERQAGR